MSARVDSGRTAVQSRTARLGGKLTSGCQTRIGTGAVANGSALSFMPVGKGYRRCAQAAHLPLGVGEDDAPAKGRRVQCKLGNFVVP